MDVHHAYACVYLRCIRRRFHTGTTGECLAAVCPELRRGKCQNSAAPKLDACIKELRGFLPTCQSFGGLAFIKSFKLDPGCKLYCVRCPMALP